MTEYITRGNPGTQAEIDQIHARAIEALRGARTWAVAWVETNDQDEATVKAMCGGVGPLSDFLLVAGGCDTLAARTHDLVMEALAEEPEES